MLRLYRFCPGYLLVVLHGRFPVVPLDAAISSCFVAIFLPLYQILLGGAGLVSEGREGAKLPDLEMLPGHSENVN